MKIFLFIIILIIIKTKVIYEYNGKDITEHELLMNSIFDETKIYEQITSEQVKNIHQEAM
jgi:hypothetical protein